MGKINKQTLETVKTVVIAVLITGVVTFVAGAQFQAKQTAKVNAQVQSASKNQ